MTDISIQGKPGRPKAGNTISITNTYIGIFNDVMERIGYEQGKSIFIKLRTDGKKVQLLVAFDGLEGFKALGYTANRNMLSLRVVKSNRKSIQGLLGRYTIEGLTAVENGVSVYTLKLVD